MEIYVLLLFFKPGVWCTPVTPTLRRLKWLDRKFQIIPFIQLERSSQNKTPTPIIYKEMIAHQKKGTKAKSWLQSTVGERPTWDSLPGFRMLSSQGLYAGLTYYTDLKWPGRPSVPRWKLFPFIHFEPLAHLDKKQGTQWHLHKPDVCLGIISFSIYPLRKKVCKWLIRKNLLWSHMAEQVSPS